MAKVDVIIPTYNRAEFLDGAIASVLGQTFKDVTLIVVDDASVDATQKVVRDVKDKRVRYIRHETNQGEAGSRNTGLANSDARYIAFLDDDDEWLPEKLMMQVELLDNSPLQVGGVYTGIEAIDKVRGTSLGQWMPQKSGDIYRDMAVANFVGTPSTVLLRRECFDKVGMFDGSIPWGLDYDMWIRISKDYYFESINRILIKYYMHEKQITNNLEIKAKGIVALLKKHNEFFGLNPEAHSHHYAEVGTLYSDNREVKKAWRAFLKALRIYPYSSRTYICLFKGLAYCLLDDKHYWRLKKLKDRFVAG